MNRSDISKNLSAGRLVSIVALAFLAAVFVAGGASRADAEGQVVVRFAALLGMIVFVLFAPKPDYSGLRTTLWLFAASVVLVALQLVPLPPSIWANLPGRELLLEAALAAGEPQPWRPLSISPDGTVNALFSLTIPGFFLMLMGAISSEERARFLTPVLAAVAVSAVIGLVQFSGLQYNHPFVNDQPDEVSAIFANRNHYALFLAIGCLLAPAWAVQGSSMNYVRMLVSVGMLVLFSLMVLATGSRAGIIATVMALPLGFAAVWRNLRAQVKHAPRVVSIGAVVGGIAVFAAAVGASFAMGRAAAIERLILADESEGIRAQALPTIISMIQAYFPAGTGFGTFDPAYRIAEPAENLSTQYLNQAHNDFMQVALDGGLLGALLLATSLCWLAWRGVVVWRKGHKPHARLGFSMLFIVAIASLVDYPARTPIFMVLIILAASWASRTEGH